MTTTPSRRGVARDFVFMRADGAQLDRIATLVETGVVRPTSRASFRSTRRPTRSPT